MREFLTSTLALPVWLVLLFVIGNLIWLAVALFRMLRKRSPVVYRKDRFFGIDWHWGYRGDTPTDVQPHCVTDGTQLVYTSDGSSVNFHCETCGHDVGPLSGDYRYVLGMVGRQIERRIKDGNWSNA